MVNWGHIPTNLSHAGRSGFAALTSNDQYFISVLDLTSLVFLPAFRAFPKVPTEDGDFDEHEVEGIDLHPDETCIAYTNMFTSEVVFADFKGNRLRTIPRK